MPSFFPLEFFDDQVTSLSVCVSCFGCQCFPVSMFGFRVLGFGVRGSGFSFWVQGLGVTV